MKLLKALTIIVATPVVVIGCLAAGGDARTPAELAREEASRQRIAAERAAYDAELNGTKCTKNKQAIIGESTARTIKCGWGKPRTINRTLNGNLEREQWVFGNGNYLYFINGRLTSIQTSN